MDTIAFDTETALFGPGLMAPPLVCLSWDDGTESGLMDRADGLAWIRFQLSQTDNHLVGQRTAYDLCVLAAEDATLLPLIFNALDNGRFGDTKLREQLLAIADGTFDTQRYSLKDLASKRLGLDMDKGAVRTTFGALRGIPISQWPEGHRAYARGDATITRLVWLKQEAERESERWGDLLFDEACQVRASVALQLMTCWGMRTEATKVAEVAKGLYADKAVQDAKLQALGVVRANGTKDMSVIRDMVTKAYGGNPPTTPAGGVATSKQVLLDSGDPLLEDIAEGGKAAKYISTYLPWLEWGIHAPINPGYSPLKVTSRTGSSNPNIQNFPVKGGLRECFIPRLGFIFADVDYATLELRTLAQSCLDLVGSSNMAEALKKEALEGGPDLHSLLAGTIFNEDPVEIKRLEKLGDPEAKAKRTLSKAANFGLPAGSSSATFIKFAKSAYKIDVTQDQADNTKKVFFEQWPEVKAMQKICAGIADKDGTIKLPRSKRVHGGKWFTNLTNLLFQGPAADGAKAALYRVSRACYVEESSVLYGSRPVAFVHDQILCEVPISKGEACLKEIERIMVAVMIETATPDIPVAVDGKLLTHWGK